MLCLDGDSGGILIQLPTVQGGHKTIAKTPRAVFVEVWFPIHQLSYHAKPTSSPQDLQFIEFFAGEGRVWRTMRVDSVNAVGVDYNYFDGSEAHNHFDILSTSGFGFHP